MLIYRVSGMTMTIHRQAMIESFDGDGSGTGGRLASPNAVPPCPI